MRLLAPLLLLLSVIGAQAAPSSQQDSAWVQAVDHGFEARLVTHSATCPPLHTDKGDVNMTARAAASDKFPLLCAAPLPDGIHSAQAASLALPVPVAHPTRILVLGDTGCRIKGAALQACNDPAQWPFPQVAAAAARLKPDLVIHVGDYLYRESACPQGNAGCAGSPWGDNWTTWKADFYDPAAPLLAAAPIVLARGNHEDCTRAGPGWVRLQGSSPFDGACIVHQPLFTVTLGGLTLAVLDDAVSNEIDLDRDVAKVYADELAGLAKAPAPVWLVHHRPTWAAVSGPLGIPIGGNFTLMEASRINAAKGGPLIPAPVELMLSGHIHTFEAINYQGGVPPQIVGGNGGDNLDVTPKNLRGAQFLGHSGVTVADGLSVGGFGFLLMTKVADGWSIELYDPQAQPKGQCHFTTPQGRAKGKAVGRLDCPGLKT
ncbi:MAG TPA: metallophosphoesterase [Rhizomicrobium sp.]